MSRQLSSPQSEQNSSIRESTHWLLGSALFLAMLLAGYSEVLSIPSWVFYVIAFGLVTPLVAKAPTWEKTYRSTSSSSQNLGRIFLYISFFAVGIEAVWFGLVQREWQLLAIWFPVTLLIGVFLNLLISTILEKGLPVRYFLVPTISLLLGGFIGFFIPNLGFSNGLLFSFVILSLGTAFWLRFYREKSQ